MRLLPRFPHRLHFAPFLLHYHSFCIFLNELKANQRQYVSLLISISKNKDTLLHRHNYQLQYKLNIDKILLSKLQSSPWPVWLSGLNIGLRIKRSLVGFPVRAHAWVAGQDSWCGMRERQPHIDVSLPLFLPYFPTVSKNK